MGTDAEEAKERWKTTRWAEEDNWLAVRYWLQEIRVWILTLLCVWHEANLVASWSLGSFLIKWGLGTSSQDNLKLSHLHHKQVEEMNRGGLGMQSSCNSENPVYREIQWGGHRGQGKRTAEMLKIQSQSPPPGHWRADQNGKTVCQLVAQRSGGWGGGTGGKDRKPERNKIRKEAKLASHPVKVWFSHKSNRIKAMSWNAGRHRNLTGKKNPVAVQSQESPDLRLHPCLQHRTPHIQTWVRRRLKLWR